MPYRYYFIFFSFFLFGLGLIAQPQSIAVHAEYGSSLLAVLDNPHTQNRLYVYQNGRAPRGGFVELFYLSPAHDTLWTFMPINTIHGDINSWLSIKYIRFDQDSSITIWANFLDCDFGGGQLIRLAESSGEWLNEQEGLIDRIEFVEPYEDDTYLVLNTTSYVLVNQNWEPISTASPAAWNTDGWAIKDFRLSADKRFFVRLLDCATDFNPALSCASRLELGHVVTGGNNLNMGVLWPLVADLEGKITNLVTKAANNNLYFMLANTLYHFDGQFNVINQTTLPFAGENVFGFHAEGQLHFLRYAAEDNKHYLYALNDSSYAITATTVINSVPRLEFTHAVLKEGIYTLAGAREGQLFPDSYWRNEKEAVEAKLPMGDTLSMPSASDLVITAVSTSGSSQIYRTDRNRWDLAFSDVRVELQNAGAEIIRDFYLNSVLQISIPGYCPINTTERKRFQSMDIAPGEVVTVAFGDLFFSGQRANAEVCFTLSNLNEQASEEYEGKKYCFYTISSTQETVDVLPNLLLYSPSAGQWNLESEEKIRQVAIYDFLGRLVYQSGLLVSENTHRIAFQEPAGAYFARVQLSSGRSLTRKFVQP